MKKNSNYDPIRKRYNRLAFVYNFIEAPLEYFRFASWRKRLGDRIVGGRALEVGVGTGKNLPYYPGEIEITAIDFSPGMLKRARKKASMQEEHVAKIIKSKELHKYTESSITDPDLSLGIA